jgi:hypothetical protein
MMANLVKLKEFDRELQLVREDMRRLDLRKTVWTQDQDLQISQLMGAIKHLFNAVQELANNNRDGRG